MKCWTRFYPGEPPAQPGRAVREPPGCRTSSPVTAVLLGWHTCFMQQASYGMEQGQVVREVIKGPNGSAMWRICWRELCVEDASGSKAMSDLQKLFSRQEK